MPKAPYQNFDVHDLGPNAGAFLTLPSSTFPRHSHLLKCGLGDHQYPPLSAQNQESRGMSDHVDGSGPIFSLYLEMAAEEDKKMTENWKEDADSILIFVRRYLLFPNFMYANTQVIDWIILCCCRILDLSVDSGPPAKPAGHIQLLPCQYVSNYD